MGGEWAARNLVIVTGGRFLRLSGGRAAFTSGVIPVPVAVCAAMLPGCQLNGRAPARSVAISMVALQPNERRFRRTPRQGPWGEAIGTSSPWDYLAGTGVLAIGIDERLTGRSVNRLGEQRAGSPRQKHMDGVVFGQREHGRHHAA